MDSIEFARMEASVFDGLRMGTRVLNEIHSEMSLEAVEELMADTRAALQHQEVRLASLRCPSVANSRSHRRWTRVCQRR